MTVIFDGKKIANDIRTNLKKEAVVLQKKDITPKLVSILVGDDKESQKYLSLKKSAAEDLGFTLDIKQFDENTTEDLLIEAIQDFNLDKTVHGIMVQLPLPKGFSKDQRDRIISTIMSKKDVDGMKKDSHYLSPVVKAVLTSMKIATFDTKLNENTLIVVLGAEGFVGEKIFTALQEMGYRVRGEDVKSKFDYSEIKKADILISATGENNLVTEDMVRQEAVLIDVGAPGAEITKEACAKSSFYTPVPGGIGPLTIEFLLENLFLAAK